MADPRIGVTRWSNLRPVPWKNGGGLTRELVSSPRVAGAPVPDWRVSLADIEQPGPFSTFPGVDRVITLLEGPAAVLTSDTWTHTLVPGDPFRFSGDDAVTCGLPHGPCRVLNVMTSHDGPHAEVQVGHLDAQVLLDTDPDPWRRLLLVSLVDGLRVSSSGEAWTLRRYDLLEASEATEPLEVQPGRVVAVRIAEGPR